VIQDKAEEKTVTGLHIPKQAQEIPNTGKVLQFGPKVEDETIRKIGVTAVFGKYSGVKIPVNGEECLLLREEEILGVYTVDEAFAIDRKPKLYDPALDEE
jgi:chaperonin GroES